MNLNGAADGVRRSALLSEPRPFQGREVAGTGTTTQSLNQKGICLFWIKERWLNLISLPSLL